MNHVYTRKLGDIKMGRPFMMVNYPGCFIRVSGEPNWILRRMAAAGMMDFSFNDDGEHVPIVDLSTGNLSFMSKEKPCMLYPNESVKNGW